MSHGGESLLSILFKFANFAILLAIVVKFAGKRFKNYLSERHERIKSEVESRKKEIEDGKIRLEEIRRKLDDLDREIDEVKRRVLDEARSEKERIMSEVKAQKDKVESQLSLIRELEISEMKKRLRQEIAERAVLEAERIIKSNVRPEDHERLVKDFLDRLRSLP